jgi:hypothetical protein
MTENDDKELISWVVSLVAYAMDVTARILMHIPSDSLCN